jgi:leucyl-tRNA synthetase
MYRYFDPRNEEQIFNSELVKKWEPIDFYNGADHATAHLLYARFLARFFTKIGLVNDPEPFKQFVFNGKVTASDGTGFSKSKGNGIDPLEIINSGYGADSLRVYLMFAAPLEVWTRWDPQGVPGAFRFLNRLWTLVGEYNEAKEGNLSSEQEEALRRVINPVIKKVTEDLEANRYNTAIAASMGCLNELYKLKAKELVKCPTWQETLDSLVALVAPFAPHVADELWQQLGHSFSVNLDSWPKYDEKYLNSDTVIIVVQINGKLRAELQLPAGASEEEVSKAAKENDKVQKQLAGQTITKAIYVPDKLINIVTS